MIERIEIRNVATYGPTVETLSDLKEINFVYGSNATGKTTISRVIADCDSHRDCSLTWRGGTSIDLLVYNRDFVNRNFNQPNELKGIFTLGEEDRDAIDKINAAKISLKKTEDKIAQLKNSLYGEDGNGGQRAALAELESDFKGKCWKLKLKHDNKLKEAFPRIRGDKGKFKARMLAESVSNSSAAVSLADIEKKAETVFGALPRAAIALIVPDGARLLAHEAESILSKKVIGKMDVDIAALIQKIGNSDWVKQGRNFYDSEMRVCPFCQQDTPISLEERLNEYFDETFIEDTESIENLYANYKTDSDRLQQSIQVLLDNPSRFLESEKLQTESDLLKSKILINIQRLSEKRRESSKSVDLESLKNVLDEVKLLVERANTAIHETNAIVSNFEAEKMDLTGQVWRYLLDYEIESDLASYVAKKSGNSNAIESLETQIGERTTEQLAKVQEIRDLEKDITSILPTIHGINSLLRAFGFTGFKLAKSDTERFYKIQRSDGSDAKETLSEGESSFITFLYFYHLLKGSDTESGMTSDRIVVFDDPVSSLDSDTLFVVSSLIRGLFEEIRKKTGTIKQVFILTHNVYFHKEVSLSVNRPRGGKRNDETFWTVRKANEVSKIKAHKINPIKTSYELLWMEVKNSERDNLSIPNTLRRILEYYFTILGHVDPNEICARFDGDEKFICRSLFSWVNAGSHFADDSLYVSVDISMIEAYMSVFKQVFEKTNHMAHYEMMVRSEPVVSDTSDSASVANL